MTSPIKQLSIEEFETEYLKSFQGSQQYDQLNRLINTREVCLSGKKGNSPWNSPHFTLIDWDYKLMNAEKSLVMQLQHVIEIQKKTVQLQQKYLETSEEKKRREWKIICATKTLVVTGVFFALRLFYNSIST
ncbi:MAG: hypothetical protein H0W88_04600 [Parachlamydiaceae bacterium]|nr:hypothetical protein [Parachlamydiaceae bacterium]